MKKVVRLIVNGEPIRHYFVMRRVVLLAVCLASFAAIGFLSAPKAMAGGQTGSDKLDAASMKSMVEGLGYELKELNGEAGKEKYEFTITKSGLDIPIACEISASRNYVWLTVFLGEAPKGSAGASKFENFLKDNFQIQPSFFYITSKGNLMCGIALENRAMSPAIMKRNIEKLSDDVAKTKDHWLDN